MTTVRKLGDENNNSLPPSCLLTGKSIFRKPPHRVMKAKAGVRTHSFTESPTKIRGKVSLHEILVNGGVVVTAHRKSALGKVFTLLPCGLRPLRLEQIE